MVELNFDANTVDPQTEFELLAPGWYNAVIEKSEQKMTKKNDGSYITLMFKIIEGPAVGRTLFTNLNTDNPSAKAVEIAYRQLSSICHAVGIMQVADTAELHNLPLQIQVKVTPAKGEHDAKNEVKNYKAIDATSTDYTQEAVPTTSSDGSDDDPKPPWEE